MKFTVKNETLCRKSLTRLWKIRSFQSDACNLSVLWDPTLFCQFYVTLTFISFRHAVRRKFGPPCLSRKSSTSVLHRLRSILLMPLRLSLSLFEALRWRYVYEFQRSKGNLLVPRVAWHEIPNWFEVCPPNIALEVRKEASFWKVVPNNNLALMRNMGSDGGEVRTGVS